MSRAQARLMDRLPIQAIDLAAPGSADLDGRYDAFLDGHGCEAILVRPDFHLFGGVATVGEAGDLLDALGRAVSGAMRAAPVPDRDGGFEGAVARHGQGGLAATMPAQ